MPNASDNAWIAEFGEGLYPFNPTVEARDLKALGLALRDPNVRPRLQDLKFAPLQWLSGPHSDEEKAFAAEWVRTLADPQDAADHAEHLVWRGSSSADAHALDALWAGLSDWMAAGSLEAVVARGNGVNAIVHHRRPDEHLLPHECVWLDRLLSSQSDLPIVANSLTAHRIAPNANLKLSDFLPSFLTHRSIGVERQHDIAEAMERAFGLPKLREHVSAQFMKAQTRGDPLVYNLKSPWILVAAGRGWLEGAALRALWGTEVYGDNKKHPVAKAIVEQWQDGKPEPVQALNVFVCQGLDLNETFRVANRVSPSTTTALNCAIRAAKPDLVERLLSLGADPLRPIQQVNGQGQPIGRAQDANDFLRKARSDIGRRVDAPSLAPQMARIGAALQAAQARSAVNGLLHSLDLSTKAHRP